MPEAVSAKSAASAEKAYAAASEALDKPAASLDVAAVEFPPKAKRTAKASTGAAAAKKAVTAPAKKIVSKHTSSTSRIKDAIMSAKTAEPVAAVKEALADAQAKAKEAFTKSSALFSEAGEFTKGNVEALVESGKILASGLQTMGKDYVTEGKTAFETVQADIKELAAVKSPADFFKLQGEIMRRNFDAVVTAGSKHSEAVLKLTNDAFAPVSTRVSLAIEKVKKAA